MKRVAVAVISMLVGVSTIAYGQAAKANVVNQDQQEKRVCVCRKAEGKWQTRKLSYKDKQPGDFEYLGKDKDLASPDTSWCEKKDYEYKHEHKKHEPKPGPVVDPTPSPLPEPEVQPEVEPQIQTQSQNNIVLTPAQLAPTPVDEPVGLPTVGGTAKSHK